MSPIVIFTRPALEAAVVDFFPSLELASADADAWESVNDLEYDNHDSKQTEHNRYY